ncbi:MAG: MoaD/ThiS family protein [Ignavibacteria bacterium]|nr:MoaD/ThiS family protein [Ignavibacteria bacterium]
MKIIPFGKLADILENNVVFVDHILDTDGLRHALEIQFPQISHIQYLVAVNRKIVTENTLISSDATIALLPPFSGG